MLLDIIIAPIVAAAFKVIVAGWYGDNYRLVNNRNALKRRETTTLQWFTSADVWWAFETKGEWGINWNRTVISFAGRVEIGNQFFCLCDAMQTDCFDKAGVFQKQKNRAIFYSYLLWYNPYQCSQDLQIYIKNLTIKRMTIRKKQLFAIPYTWVLRK